MRRATYRNVPNTTTESSDSSSDNDSVGNEAKIETKNDIPHVKRRFNNTRGYSRGAFLDTTNPNRPIRNTYQRTVCNASYYLNNNYSRVINTNENKQENKHEPENKNEQENEHEPENKHEQDNKHEPENRNEQENNNRHVEINNDYAIRYKYHKVHNRESSPVETISRDNNSPTKINSHNNHTRNIVSPIKIDKNEYQKSHNKESTAAKGKSRNNSPIRIDKTDENEHKKLKKGYKLSYEWIAMESSLNQNISNTINNNHTNGIKFSNKQTGNLLGTYKTGK